MSDSGAAQQPERISQDAPDENGGVPRTSDAKAGPVQETPEPERKPIPQKREDIRGLLALILAGFFGATLLARFVAAMLSGEAWTNSQDFLQSALPAVTGLFGSAVGFYFGSQR